MITLKLKSSCMLGKFSCVAGMKQGHYGLTLMSLRKNTVKNSHERFCSCIVGVQNGAWF